ncbi:MAG: dTMP kinase [Gammaproteobacteria bacterium]|nr:dTMP kinase [Gammaproteobacteria bacterium]
MGRGRFITIEGTEGVGKTTNLENVAELARSAGYQVVTTREPGGTSLAEDIRGLLLKVSEETMNPTAELLLIFAARAQHIAQVIEPALADGSWVVCDRFTDATYAYQGGGRQVDAAAIGVLEELVQGGLRPDLTLYLDVPVDIASARIAARDHDRFEREQKAFFERVRTAYLARARDHARIRVIDASVELVQVKKAISIIIDQFIRESA